MKRRHESIKSGFVPSFVVVVCAALLFYLMITNDRTAAADAPSVMVPTGQVGVFGANAATLGGIPDHPGLCWTSPFNTGRDVTFTVTGLDGVVKDAQLSMTFSPGHPFMGDIMARLNTPMGGGHTIFGRTGSTTSTGAGDSTDLSGNYIFRDGAVPPNGGWWQTASLLGASTPMTSGAYRTTDSGGQFATDPQPATSMNNAFNTISNANGTWTLNVRDGCNINTGGISAAALTLEVRIARARADFDGDGKTDLSVYRPSEGNWYVNHSTAGFSVTSWGLSTDIPAPGDFDGDGKQDHAIFRPSTGTWWILRSTGGVTSTQFGTAGDIPVVGDYDDDGVADIALFRPSTSFWFLLYSGGGFNFIKYGAAGDLPVPGDYDGDAITDKAIYRPSNGQWWINNSANGGLRLLTFGNSTDKPVPADYDGDNKQDIAIWRPSNGQWWTVPSSGFNVTTVSFGLPNDIPVPGDYDGDGRDDQAVYRNGVWWLNRSTSGVTAQSFGVSTDIPIPAKYIP